MMNLCCRRRKFVVASSNEVQESLFESQKMLPFQIHDIYKIRVIEKIRNLSARTMTYSI